MIFKIFDDPDVIKNHKNAVATFPNMLYRLGIPNESFFRMYPNC